jgi:hypothetical protein
MQSLVPNAATATGSVVQIKSGGTPECSLSLQIIVLLVLDHHART